MPSDPPASNEHTQLETDLSGPLNDAVNVPDVYRQALIRAARNPIHSYDVERGLRRLRQAMAARNTKDDTGTCPATGREP